MRMVVSLSRLVQYGSKTVSWVMEVEGVSADLVKKIKNLEASISTARKRKLYAPLIYNLVLNFCTQVVLI